MSELRIVVAGALANKPGYGGEAWVRLDWVRGLTALGADVRFVEELAPGADRVRGAAFFADVCARFALTDRCSLFTPDGAWVAGLPPEAVADFASGADLLVNISGNLAWAPVFQGPRRRAYIDLDPGFTQFWHASRTPVRGLDRHQLHFTVGESIGTSGCPVPTGWIRWLPLRQPVVLDDWATSARPEHPRFTTVASWRGAYGGVEFEGRRYGLKVHEFRRFAWLPQALPLPAEIALDIHPADEPDRLLLEGAGWRLEDPARVASTPERFRDYVRGSAAELSVAQGIYVETRCGWFSDRSARYLAAGRPVVVQDTGFGRHLPVGEGLLSFRTHEEALAAARDVAGDPARHGRAARQIAEQCFDARVVLTGFLERALDGGARRARRAAPIEDAPQESAAASDAPRPPEEAKAPGGQGAPRRDGPPPVIVSGMVAAVPGRGGASWAVLQYVLGLRRLGRDVHLIEQIAESALRSEGVPFERSDNARYFEYVTRAFGLDGHATLLLAGTERTVGRPYRELVDVCGRAGALLNLSGILTDAQLKDPAPVRVYLDIDPAFTQLWQSAEGVDMRFDGHTHFATVGLEVGASDCPVPTCGLDWIHTLPPVVLSHWEAAERAPLHDWTTVAHWRGYGSIEHDGVRYGQKAHAFRELFELPPRTGDRFDVALDIHPDEHADLRALEANHWHLLDPARVAGDPVRYRRFVQDSTAEVGVAKSGYVVSRCGWFSDRSACYLASGRPVLGQDTGFSRHLPTGLGLLAFRDLEEAAAGVAAVRADYRTHARAARSIAEEHLDSDRVLTRLLEEVGA